MRDLRSLVRAKIKNYFMSFNIFSGEGRGSEYMNEELSKLIEARRKKAKD